MVCTLACTENDLMESFRRWFVMEVSLEPPTHCVGTAMAIGLCHSQNDTSQVVLLCAKQRREACVCGGVCRAEGNRVWGREVCLPVFLV